MGCCVSTSSSDEKGRGSNNNNSKVRTGTEKGLTYKDGANNNNKDQSSTTVSGAKSPARKELTGTTVQNNYNEDEDGNEDLNSDNASVSSRKSIVSVSSTRSSKALATGGTIIPKSQDALLALSRTTKSASDGFVSPSAKGLDMRALKHATTNSTGMGIYGTDSGMGSTASPTSQGGEGSLEAARNEMSMFVWGDYNVDPLDAIEQRNARYGGAVATGGSKKVPKKHLGSSLNSTVGGVQFVLNDFVIKTMDEEMIDAENFRTTVVREEFFGDRPLRNSSCRCMLGHGARVKAIAVAPDEATFVSSSVEDNDILQQFVSGRGELFYFTGHGAAIVSLSFSRDGHYFASTSRDASIAVWDAQQGTVHKRVRWLDADCGGGGSIPIANAFSWNGQYICAGYQDRVCRVWDLDRNNVITHFTEHEGIVICVSCHPSELICASGGADRNVFLWKLETGEVVFKCSGHDNAVISVNFTPNGESLISSDDKSCKIWNVHTGKLNLTVHVGDIVSSMPTIANKNRVVTAVVTNAGTGSVSGTLGSTQRPSASNAASAGLNNENGSGPQKKQQQPPTQQQQQQQPQLLTNEPETSLPGSTVANSASSTVTDTSSQPTTTTNMIRVTNPALPGVETSNHNNNNSPVGSDQSTVTNMNTLFAPSSPVTSNTTSLHRQININNNNNNTNNKTSSNSPSTTSLGVNNNSNQLTTTSSNIYIDRLPLALRNALNGRNSLATARKAFQSTAAISQRMAFTVSCPCPGSFSTGYFAVASTAKSVHIISITTGREETSFAAKAPVFALACGRDEILMFGDTFGNLYVAELK